jgi:hypothetical protein
MSADASNSPGLRPPAPSTAAGSRQPAAAITGAIRKAAQATGASFDYLLATAKVESDLNPNLTMKSSSASGLFQFIEQTWLETLQQAGRALGYGRYADAIGQTPSGRYVVKDPELRSEVMALRQDPTANAAMGGAFTQQNAVGLTRRLGRSPSEGELYMAHFFGPGAAAKVIQLAGSNPQANAADLFPAAARANRPIFYDQQGNARSVAGVSAELQRRYQVARASPPRAPALATAASKATPVQNAPPPATAAIAPAFAAVPVLKSAGSEAARPVFHSLFHSDERRGPVSPVAAELWGVSAARAGAEEGKVASAPAPPVSALAPPASAKAGNGLPLDLFQELRPNVRALFDGSV